MTLKVDVQFAVYAPDVPASEVFLDWATAAAGDQGRGRELSIKIVDEAEGQQLNSEYRGKDYATNILSFPAEPLPEMEMTILGDLAICAPVIAREARQQGKSPTAHWAHMVVHGTLHLLGYAHQHQADAEVMESLEVTILAKLGIDDPYKGNN